MADIVAGSAAEERARWQPFDLGLLGMQPPGVIHEAELARIRLLPEYGTVLDDWELLMRARDHDAGSLHANIVSYIEASNAFRTTFLPNFAREEPNDRLLAAQFFQVDDPEHASWAQIHEAAHRRRKFMEQLHQLLSADQVWPWRG